MVGKPGTAPGLLVPKTRGLLLSHIPMKFWQGMMESHHRDGVQSATVYC